MLGRRVSFEKLLKIYPTPGKCRGIPAFGKTVEFALRALNDLGQIIAVSEYLSHHRLGL
jgi:hypothetical protein